MRKRCMVEGCELPHSAKGYCNAHYLQHREYGKIIKVEIERRDSGRGCMVENCDGKHSGNGYCIRHNAQNRRYGKIISKERMLGPRIGKMLTNGYIYLLKKTHPFAIKKGYVKRANLVWEENTGHVVRPPEIIHHKNFIKTDDAFDNLELMPDSSEHMRKYHPKGYTYSKEDIINETLRVYRIVGNPFTIERFEGISRISSDVITSRYGWNALKEELCIR